MGIVDSFNDLPQPAKIGLVGVAVGGVLILLMTRRTPTPVDTAQSQQSGPVVLPPGAGADNSGEVQQNTLAMVNQLISQSSASFQSLIAANQAATADQLAQMQNTTSAAIASSSQALQDQQTAQNNALLAMINALKALINKPSTGSPVQEPIGQNPPTPAPTKPKPVPTPTPGPVNNPGNPGQSLYLRDVKSWIGGVQDILTWVRGSSYGIHKTGEYQGDGRAAQAGEKDYNVGLYLPVAYNVNQDTWRGDYSTHKASESFFSHWAGRTINLMQAHSDLSQYEAGMMTLSMLKKGLQERGESFYSTGFDFSKVPDNYGRGTYWN